MFAYELSKKSELVVKYRDIVEESSQALHKQPLKAF
jgi:hypothetical protein